MGKNNKRHTIEEVKKYFEEKDYTLISTIYKNKESKLEYICNKHKDYGIQTVTLAAFKKDKNNCELCKSEYFKKYWHEVRNFKPISNEEFRNKHFEEYKNKLYELVKDEYTLLDTFKDNDKTFIKLKHNICGNIYNVNKSKFFTRNNRCMNPECVHNRRRKQHLRDPKEINKQIYDVVGDEYNILSEYTGINDYMMFKHNICGRTFKMTPHNFIFNKQRCPYCKVSKGEQTIEQILKSKNIIFESQKKYENLIGTGGRLLSYDFYIPDYNLLIEYQGQFHDGSVSFQTDEMLKKQQEHDRMKREYAKNHNINLLEIWYWDFDNIDEILNNYFNNYSKLNVS